MTACRHGPGNLTAMRNGVAQMGMNPENIAHDTQKSGIDSYGLHRDNHKTTIRDIFVSVCIKNLTIPSIAASRRLRYINR